MSYFKSLSIKLKLIAAGAVSLLFFLLSVIVTSRMSNRAKLNHDLDSLKLKLKIKSVNEDGSEIEQDIESLERDIFIAKNRIQALDDASFDPDSVSGEELERFFTSRGL